MCDINIGNGAFYSNSFQMTVNLEGGPFKLTGIGESRQICNIHNKLKIIYKINTSTCNSHWHSVC